MTNIAMEAMAHRNRFTFLKMVGFSMAMLNNQMVALSNPVCCSSFVFDKIWEIGQHDHSTYKLLEYLMTLWWALVPFFGTDIIELCTLYTSGALYTVNESTDAQILEFSSLRSTPGTVSVAVVPEQWTVVRYCNFARVCLGLAGPSFHCHAGDTVKLFPARQELENLLEMEIGKLWSSQPCLMTRMQF